jgi:autotransporter strand-loop-strand O-heptosyltransferase
MKLIQVTPGVITIPPNGWGAVEKIIWEYKLVLDKLGYKTDILYTDDVKKSDDQIVHVHMANLANLLNSRGIDYVYSLHDHHVEHFGKDSACYKENYQAIKNSKLTFVHSKHLIEYFDNLPQIVYLPHGSNLNDYKFVDRSESIRKEVKLFMMANNGVGGDTLADRKGFLIGIDSAKELDLPITIICPGSNKQFFDHHNPQYDKLEIIYDLDYADSIDKMNEFNIFLHPSNLEAGHPNLTITESLAMGIPVVGVSNIDVKGMIRVERTIYDFVNGIRECISKYDSLINDIENYRYLLSWDIIVSRMLQNYKEYFNISEKNQLNHNYLNVNKLFLDKQEKSGIFVEFKCGKTFVKTSSFTDGMVAVFKDKRTNKVIFKSDIGKDPGQWAYIYTNDREFVDWSVEVKQGLNILHKEELNLKDRRILLQTNSILEEKLITDFINETGCFLTIKSNQYFKKIKGCCFDTNADQEEFYFTLNENQLIDFFSIKKKEEDKEIFIMKTTALGDTIGFLPYAQKWAEQNNKIIDVKISNKKLDIFEYPNLNLIDQHNDYDYTDIFTFEYIFDKPLQRGYSDQFGFEYEEIQPVLKKSGLDRPIKAKYVCIGVQSTAQCKYWNYTDGWEILCKMLRKNGYTPVAVDLHEVFGIDGYWNYLPKSSVKKVGMDFKEVVRYIEHCEFFIGLSSGLSWLAYGLNKKVVMISGTTTEDNEFTINNHRVINKSVCNGCFNKSHLYKFNAGDWLWCPINKGTSKQFECSKSITPEMVFEVVSKLFDFDKSSLPDYSNDILL